MISTDLRFLVANFYNFFVREHSETQTSIINNYLSGYKISNNRKTSIHEKQKHELSKRKSLREVSAEEPEPTYPPSKHPRKLNLPDIELSTNRLANNATLLKNNASFRGDMATPTVTNTTMNVNSSNSTQNQTAVNAKNLDTVNTLENSEQLDMIKSAAYSEGSAISEAQLSKTIAAIIPRNVIERDYRPNFYFNYRQSGTKLDHSEKLRSSKSFKVNAHAPKTWLKSKYMPSSRMDSNSYLIMSYNM